MLNSPTQRSMASDQACANSPGVREAIRRRVRPPCVLVICLHPSCSPSFGGVMVKLPIVNNAPYPHPCVPIQRYAYRALASGVNAYQNAINADPYLAVCKRPPTMSAVRRPLSYQVLEHGCPTPARSTRSIPEYYKFDNPQAGHGLQQRHHRPRGADRRGGRIPGRSCLLLDSGQAHPTERVPENAVRWSNDESFEFPVGSATNCKYFWSAGVGRNTGNLSPCNIVVFQTGDKLVGPVSSNDSIDITGSPTFGTPTASRPRAALTAVR